MNESTRKALLPDGLRDVLPPDAAHEAAVAGRLVAAFAARGYRRVDPPLVEFEDSLLDGAGQAMATGTFRLMDPVSQRMMGVRADMTIQVARIAATRLANAPRPLRLAYAGNVLRVRGSQLRPERQFVQAGVEIVGTEEAAADAEIILLATAALGEAGVENLSVDINLPTLVPALCRALDLDEETQVALRAALDSKDAAAVAAAGGQAAVWLGALLRATGAVDKALPALKALDLPAVAAAECERLEEVVGLIREAAPNLTLTVDPVEHRGFEYQTGLSFTVFARGVRGEMGRGGRYHVTGNGEPATGFSLFLDSVLRALPHPDNGRSLYLPHGTKATRGAALRAEGWVTVAGLAPESDPAAEARRLGCTHILRDDDVVEIGDSPDNQI
ncbi:MAG: ATP phosphoribosyltransferase regulatory subunit [Alphaproteobacteria bacterium]|nr:ATP phosphoribosyltransferase regulatory subunit [Alphaproteobacteria bacterium]